MDDLRRAHRPPLARVLVTGASGFIGSHLVATLLDKGIDVVALRRNRAPRSQNGVESWIADVTDPASLRGAADGCDTVVHLAGLAHQIGLEPSDADFDRVNVDGTRALLDEAARSNVARFLFMSSVAAGGSSSSRPLAESDSPQPSDAYGRSKIRAEALVRRAGENGHLWTAVLRPPLVYGPGNRGNFPRLASLVRRRMPLPFGGISNARSVVFVGNLVHATVLLVEREPGRGDVFYVADDSPVSTADLVREIAAAIGVRARLLSVPVGALTTLARAGNLIAKFHRFPFTTRELGKLTRTLTVDDSKLRRATGYKPLMTTHAGIRATFSSETFSADKRPEAGRDES